MKQNQNNQELIQILKEIQQGIKQLNSQQKNLLTVEEAAEIFGVSKSYLYKLTSKNLIPFYKPTGKVIYISRSELEDIIKAGKVSSIDEIKVIVNDLKI